MRDPLVETAMAHWAPRMIQNGVDYNDFVRTTARTQTWDDWLPEWSRTADEHVELAERTEAEGHVQTAGHAWRRASVDRHFGKFVWQLDLDLVDEAMDVGHEVAVDLVEIGGDDGTEQEAAEAGRRV